MPIETDPTTYYLVCYDADGRERRDGDGLLSEQVLRRAEQDGVSDVVLMSHGWNGDLPAARAQYGRWLSAMVACRAGRPLAVDGDAFRPLVVGLHWPSKAWGDEELGATSFSTGAAPATDGSARSFEALVDEYTERLDGTPAVRAAVRTVLEAALDDIAPATLPPAVRAAYAVLDEQVGASALGHGAEPGADREPFDPDAVYAAVQQEELLVPYGGLGGLGGLLAPLRTLTFWHMKRRALHVGQTGAAELVRRLASLRPAGRSLRLHLVGHSFGCIVVSASVTGGRGGPTPVDSLVLVQGALSLWSFAPTIPVRPSRSGYFSRVVTDSLVRGPVVVTTSEHDRAVGTFYPLGAGVARQVDFAPGTLPTYGATGTFGARGVDDVVDDLEVGGVDDAYDLRPGRIHDVDCSSVIATGDGPSGAHSDIAHPEVAHLVLSAVGAATPAVP